MTEPSDAVAPAAADNPLLLAGPIPAFDRLRAEHVEPAIRKILDDIEHGLAEIERNAAPSWSALVEPLEQLGEPLRFAWGTVGHLMSVRNSAELRAAYEKMQPEVVRVMSRLGQSKPIYEAAKQLRQSDDFRQLDDAQRRIIEKMVQAAELSGVGLEGPDKDRFNAIRTELSELSTKFSNAVLDATKEFGLDLTDPDDVAGLPSSAKQLMAQAARAAGHENATADDGPWRVTLDLPSLVPFLQHAQNRQLRERLYRANLTKASDGEHDNSERIVRILALRQEKAELLGFRDYAELSLASKMADGVDEVLELLEDLRARSYPAAQRDLDDLRAFAEECGAPEADDLRHWDIAYWAERLREKRFAFTDEELRPYFPLPRVLDGLFSLAERLFDVRIQSADGEVPVWHDDVRFFRVSDTRRGEPIAAFFLDPYSRPADKRGGAWMDECVGRSKLFAPRGADVRLPIAYLVCNQTPPVGEVPSLMTFREVETLFHEFGHGLQHMLTLVDHDGAAGINGVEWDAVELPSQFMENWCYHRPTLLGFSGHYETGEPLPEALFEKIQKARTFRAGSDMLRQLYFGLLDMALHHGYDPERDGSPFEIQHRVAEKAAVLEPLPEDRFLCSFAHIFAGGYAAGYYSYKWAEVLSADAFSAFEDAGLDDEDAVRATGRRFRETILALGGSKHPMEVFEAFRGREPEPDALLRHSGLGT